MDLLEARQLVARRLVLMCERRVKRSREVGPQFAGEDTVATQFVADVNSTPLAFILGLVAD